jgi:hypothetical protein
MDDDVRRRHLRAAWDETLLATDRFDDSEGRVPDPWRVIGGVQARPVRVAGRLGAEIVAPRTGWADCRLERPLMPTQTAGRDVCLDIELACPARNRAEAVTGARLSIITRDNNGHARETFLPLAIDVTPGWEHQRWWLRFGPLAGESTLRLHFIQPNAALLIGGVRLTARDWSEPPVPAATSRPAEARNLVAGGSFETGRRAFVGCTLLRWPNGEETAAALPFEVDPDAGVGERALRLHVENGTGRLAFGPLDYLGGSRASGGPVIRYLRFLARAGRPANLTVSLQTRRRTLDRNSFTIGPEWQAFTAVMNIAVRPEDAAGSPVAELVFDFPNPGGAEPLDAWLDGVSLTDQPVNDYVPAEPVELGITGPAALSTDMANVVADTDPAAFNVELATTTAAKAPASAPAHAAPGPAGQLALDLLDGWDRRVWTRTTQPALGAGGRYSERISLQLPRGYYRLLASLWSGEPGRSRLISHDAARLAVVSFQDPVPLGNRYGLTSADGCVSGYTTALGAGWIRMDFPAQRVETRPGAWDMALWRGQLNLARQASVELVAGLTLPAGDRTRQAFLDAWLAASVLRPIGLILSPPAIASRPAGEYLEQLQWAGQALATGTRLVCDLSVLEGAGGETGPSLLPRIPGMVIGYAGPENALPEQSEPLLERIGRRYTDQWRVWDLDVPVRLGGNLDETDWPALAGGSLEPGGVTRLEPPLDPIVSASRMIRSLLLRALAGAQLVCCNAPAFAPARSCLEPDFQAMHEPDLSPRPAAAAFELMTSLLNDATLVRWIDQPGGVHILLFEKDDGRAVAAAWRAYGLSPTPLSLRGLPAGTSFLDCVGCPASPAAGGAADLPVNEIVRYVLVPAGQAKALGEAIDVAGRPTGVISTQPAGEAPR